MITREDLRQAEPFADLSEDELDWLIENLEERHLDTGDRPFEMGAPADHMVVILEGSMVLSTRRAGMWRPFLRRGKGRVTGMLPYSRMKHYPARAEVAEPSRFGLMHRDQFPEMLYRIPSLGQRLIGLMSDRVREDARRNTEADKMMALGKLSAGLAHELNNPASAVARSSRDLHGQVQALTAIAARLVRHPSIADALTSLPKDGGQGAPDDPLERADLEDQILDWLEAHDVEEAWKLAPSLAETGFAIDDLESISASVQPEALADVIAWIEARGSAVRLIDTIGQAAERISGLVGAIKNYSHMDRSPDRQPVDLRKGIDDTLTILAHKVKEKSIQVSRRVEPDLPDVNGYPGELNQVWTNLIDNAIDAMSEGGNLDIEAERQAACVAVSISDDGHGIPDDIQSRIFEPFFTTKPVGQGTGLGLDIVARIVRQHHDGEISVSSAPGRTVFSILLPLPEPGAAEG